MKKTIVRVVFAVACAAMAWAQLPGTVSWCTSTEKKQDCQDCCVATKQECASGSMPAEMCANFNFQSCVSACKGLDHDTPGTEPGTQPQGHQ